MEAESQRIEELRRRIQQDPASIAFAHLAEEHRRAGDYQEAVRVCRAGLEHHPAYVLAHVTLGRALMELEQYSEARTEFEYVLRVAPDNLVAHKSMEELQQRESPAPHGAGVAGPRTPLKLRPSTEDTSPGTTASSVASLAQAQEATPPQAQVAPPPEAQVVSPPEAVDPALEELEGWLAALQATRTDRG